MNMPSNIVSAKMERLNVEEESDLHVRSELASMKRTLEATKRLVDEMQSTIADVELRLERKKEKRIKS